MIVKCVRATSSLTVGKRYTAKEAYKSSSLNNRYAVIPTYIVKNDNGNNIHVIRGKFNIIKQ